MAMEVPVVSTDAGGMAEAITDGESGFLVPSLEPDVMAEKIKLLIVDPNLRRKIGKAGRIRVEQFFCLEKQIDTFVSNYKECIQKNS